MDSIGLYACITVICVGILLILVVQYSKLKDTKNLPVHMACLIGAILLCISDFVSVYANGKATNLCYALNYISCIVYMILMGLIPLFWLFFVMDQCTVKYYVSKRFWKVVASIAVALYGIFVITTPFHHQLFYITSIDDANPNIYVRGNCYFIQVVFSYLVFIAATAVSLYVHHFEKNPYVKKQFMLYASFLIYPSIGGFLQIFLSGLPLVNISTIFAFLIVYIYLVNYRFNLDELTGLNSKSTFRKYLENVYKNSATTSNSYLIVFDIRKFKEINTTFGHKEGDKALLRFSEILKKSCGQSAFLARYAEDEFMVVTSCFDETYLQAFINSFLDDLEENNKNYKEYGYKLEASYSFVELNPYYDTIDEIIETLEDQLNTAKQVYK